MTILGKHVIMRETLIVIISGREGSSAVLREENGKASSRVIDSSLCVTVPFPCFFTKHSYPVLNDDFGKARH